MKLLLVFSLFLTSSSAFTDKLNFIQCNLLTANSTQGIFKTHQYDSFLKKKILSQKIREEHWENALTLSDSYYGNRRVLESLNEKYQLGIDVNKFSQGKDPDNFDGPLFQKILRGDSIRYSGALSAEELAKSLYIQEIIILSRDRFASLGNSSNALSELRSAQARILRTLMSKARKDDLTFLKSMFSYLFLDNPDKFFRNQRISLSRIANTIDSWGGTIRSDVPFEKRLIWGEALFEGSRKGEFGIAHSYIADELFWKSFSPEEYHALGGILAKNSLLIPLDEFKALAKAISDPELSSEIQRLYLNTLNDSKVSSEGKDLILAKGIDLYGEKIISLSGIREIVKTYKKPSDLKKLNQLLISHLKNIENSESKRSFIQDVLFHVDINPKIELALLDQVQQIAPQELENVSMYLSVQGRIKSEKWDKFLLSRPDEYQRLKIEMISGGFEDPIKIVKEQKNLEDYYKKVIPEILGKKRAPKPFDSFNNGWGRWIESLPESKRVETMLKAFEQKSNDKELFKVFLSELEPNASSSKAISQFFLSESGLKMLGANDLDSQYLKNVFNRERGQEFFPWLGSASRGLDNMSPSSLYITLISDPSIQTIPENPFGWDYDTFSQNFRALFHRNTQLTFFRRFSDIPNRIRGNVQEVNSLKSAMIQGNLEGQGFSISRRDTGRGAGQVENDIPEFIRAFSRALNNEGDNAFKRLDPLYKRLLAKSWSFGDTGSGLINTIRQEAIDVANYDEAFWNLRVEIHNFPNRDVYNRVIAYKNSGKLIEVGEEAVAKLDTLIKNLERLLGIGQQASWVEAVLGREAAALLNALGSDLSKIKDFDGVLKVRKAWQKLTDAALKEGSLADNKAYDLLVGQNVLADFATLIADQKLQKLGGINGRGWASHLNFAENVLKNIEFDQMLTQKQVKELQDLVERINSQRNLDFNRKIELILQVYQNAIDQVYFKFSDELGIIDETLAKIARYRNKDAKVSPVKFIDSTMRSHSIFILSKWVDEVQWILTKRKNLTHEIAGKNITNPVEVFNPGESVGILRINKDPLQLTTKEIGVFTEMPVESSALGGIVTLGVGARLSHLQLLAKSLGIPNVKVSPDLLGELKNLDGKKVRIRANKKGELKIELAGREGLIAQENIKEVEVPKPNLVVEKPKSFQQLVDETLYDIAGPKGIQLSKMRTNPGLIVPDGFVLPFGFFNRYAKQTNLKPYLETLENLQLSNEYLVSKVSDQIIRHIKETPIPPKMIDEVIVELKALKRRSNSKGYFFRSDTNIEDLPNFNGAGLNESVANVLIKRKDVEDAIRKVWISPFKNKSLSWRGAALGRANASVAYPSIVVMPTIKAKASGVILSKGGKNWKPGRGIISSNWGIGSVVEAGRPVEEITLENGQILKYSLTVTDKKPVANRGGGISLKDIDRGTPVLSDKDIQQLNDAAMKIEKMLGDEAHGWDIEWAIDQSNQIIILQARPNM